MTSLDSLRHQLNGSCQNDKQQHCSSRDKSGAYDRANDCSVERTAGINDAYRYGVNVSMAENLSPTTNSGSRRIQSDPNDIPSQLLHHRLTSSTTSNHTVSRSVVSTLRMPRLFVESNPTNGAVGEREESSDGSASGSCVSHSHGGSPASINTNQSRGGIEQYTSGVNVVSSKISCSSRMKTPVMVRRNNVIGEREAALSIAFTSGGSINVDQIASRGSDLGQDSFNPSQVYLSENNSGVQLNSTRQLSSVAGRYQEAGSQSTHHELGAGVDLERGGSGTVRSSRIQSAGESSNRQTFERNIDDSRDRGRRRAREARSIDRNGENDDDHDDGTRSTRDRQRRGRSASGTRWVRRVLSIEMTLQTTTTRDERTMYVTSRTGLRRDTSAGSEGSILTAAELQLSRQGELNFDESTAASIIGDQQRRRTSCDGVLEREHSYSSSNRFGLPYEERVTSFCVENSTVPHNSQITCDTPCDGSSNVPQDRIVSHDSGLHDQSTADNSEVIRDEVCWSLVSESLQEMTRLIDGGASLTVEPAQNSVDEQQEFVEQEGRNQNENSNDSIGISASDHSFCESGFSDAEVVSRNNITQSMFSEIVLTNESISSDINRLIPTDVTEETCNSSLAHNVSSTGSSDFHSPHSQAVTDSQLEVFSEISSSRQVDDSNIRNNSLTELETSLEIVPSEVVNTVGEINTSTESSISAIANNLESQERSMTENNGISGSQTMEIDSAEECRASIATVNLNHSEVSHTEVSHSVVTHTEVSHTEVNHTEVISQTEMSHEIISQNVTSEAATVTSEAATSGAATSEAATSEAATSEAPTTSEAATSEAAMSEAAMSGAATSEAATSEATTSEAAMSESIMSAGATSAAATSEAAMSESTMSARAMSEAAMSAGAMSEAAMSESTMSSGAMSEAAMSESTMSEAAMSRAAMSGGAMSAGAMSEAAMNEGAMSAGAMSGAVMYVEEQRVLIAEKDFFKSLLGSFGTIIFLLLAAMIFYFINLFVDQDMH